MNDHSHLLHSSLSSKATDELVLLHSIYNQYLSQITPINQPKYKCPDCLHHTHPHYCLILPLLKTNLPTHLYPHIHISFSSMYPTDSPPHIEVPYCPLWTIDTLNAARSKLVQMWTEFHCDVVCFEFIDWLIDHFNLNLPSNPNPVLVCELTSPKQSSALQTEELSGLPNLFIPPTPNISRLYSHAEPIVDRKSIFLAHGAYISTQSDTNDLVTYMMQFKRIARSTHNITAYRLVNPQTQNIIQEYDDDGEKGAGKRLLHLLERAKVQNVWVMVSRWYGGIQLGPDRFAHINQVARQVLINMDLM